MAHLFFDLDGTLTDSRIGITRCLGHALEALGREVPPATELERFIGPPLADGFRKLLSTEDSELVKAAIDAYRTRYDEVGIYENRVYHGIPAALEALCAAGHELCVVTSKPEPYARRIVEHFEIGHRFEEVVGANMNGSRSAKAELVTHAVAARSAALDSTWMIGDREHDIRGAREAGVRSIAVRWGYGTENEITAARPDLVVDHPADLLRSIPEPWTAIERA